jgi:hypothetical protein
VPLHLTPVLPPSQSISPRNCSAIWWARAALKMVEYSKAGRADPVGRHAVAALRHANSRTHQSRPSRPLREARHTLLSCQSVNWPRFLACPGKVTRTLLPAHAAGSSRRINNLMAQCIHVTCASKYLLTVIPLDGPRHDRRARLRWPVLHGVRTPKGLGASTKVP